MRAGKIKTDLQGYIVLLNADACRHALKSHGFDGGGQRPPRPEDYSQLASILNSENKVLPGNELGIHGEQRFVAVKKIHGELFRTVWEVRSGKRNRAVSLVSLAIKTIKGRI